MDNTPTAPHSKNTIEALWHLQKIILNSLDFNRVVQRIVDGLLLELGYLQLGYRIIVLTLVDENANVLKRISLSKTEEAEKALAASAVPFHDIDIPLTASENILIRALNEQKDFVTHKWPEIFVPVLTPEEALHNQEASGIKTSMIFPIIAKEKSIGVLIFSMIKDESEVSVEERELIRGFTDIVGIAVENAQLYSSLEKAKNDLEKTNHELASANEQLKSLDKLKDEFLSVASHELRTPMTAIRSYLWMALDGKSGNLNEQQHLYLDRAYQSTNYLINLVNDLLNISRIESGRVSVDLQETDIVEIVNGVNAEVKPRADETGVTIGVEVTEGVPHVLADPNKIKEVLFNLIGNAIKFTPKDGHITVSIENKEGMIEVRIKDTGAGISPENMPKLFQKFGMLQDSYKNVNPNITGTGLGLYICKSIVELHHGKIWVESEGVSKGSTFAFTLKVFNKADLEDYLASQPKDTDKKVEITHTAI